ncbi:MAG: hypothetical protein Q7S65_04935 [Nanoarchaeota archaeon]|nr:hypothetical protein [Nanoarchaeota archaeon]
MPLAATTERDIGLLSRNNPRYSVVAYHLFFDGFNSAIGKLPPNYGLTPHGVVQAVVDRMVSVYGMLAEAVLSHVGIHSPGDIGGIVEGLHAYGQVTVEHPEQLDAFGRLPSLTEYIADALNVAERSSPTRILPSYPVTL